MQLQPGKIQSNLLTMLMFAAGTEVVLARAQGRQLLDEGKLSGRMRVSALVLYCICVTLSAP